MPGQSGPGSNGNEGVLCIPQTSSIAGTSPSDCLVSYPGHSLEGVLPLCREAVSVFYSPSRLGNSLLSSIQINILSDILFINEANALEFSKKIIETLLFSEVEEG